MTRQYCHIGSRTIAYLDSAPGHADLRALVLLHAFPIGANLWEPQIKSIPKGWRLITPDLRGFGGSTELDSSSALSMTDYADDVIDLLEELGVARAVIGGCSMGGYAALALYQTAPQLFDGLLLAKHARRRGLTGSRGPTGATCWRWSIVKARRVWRAR
jgi:pimeloyl-ACP methyl ester carboxylesterase